MAAIVVKGNAKPTRFAGIAGLRAKACSLIQRAIDYTAAAILVCAAGAALLQLAVQMLSFPTPVAVIGITVMAGALLNSLRRYLHTRASACRVVARRRESFRARSDKGQGSSERSRGDSRASSGRPNAGSPIGREHAGGPAA